MKKKQKIKYKIYGIYKINLFETKLSTLPDYISMNNCVEYQQYEIKIIRTLIYLLIKSPYLDYLVYQLNISKIELKLGQFQISLLIF